MGAPYSGADVFPSSFLCVDDGDPRNAAGQNIPDQALGDRGVKTSHLARLLRTPLANLTSEAVDKYVDTRTDEGAARTTVKKELRALQAVLRYAKRQGLWTGEIDRVVPEYADDYKPRTRALNWEEAKHLLVALEKPDNAQGQVRAQNRAAMVAFMLATGARWGEAVRVRRGDITGDYVHLRGTKTQGSLRTVPIIAMTRGLLDYALVACEGRTGRMFDSWSNPGRDLAVACREADIPKCSPNDLRRSLATWLRAAGVDISIIAAVLGHTTSRMVERVYGRLSPEDLRARMSGGHVDRQRGKRGGLKLLPATLTSQEKP